MAVTLDRGRTQLGYLSVDQREGEFRGAALVTDLRGIPVDFRYTEPVRPTRLERILYGGALDVYLREEVLLKNLVEAVEAKPSVWIVRDRELLRPLRRYARTPAAAVESTDLSPLDQAGQLVSLSEKGVFHLQADSISSPLMVTVPEELISQVSSLVAILTAAAEEMELLEPFVRIGRAMDAISESGA
jgi:hypothetical protein